MDWQRPIFSIGNFEVLLWHLILAIGVVIVLAVIIGIAARAVKIIKANMAAELEQEELEEEEEELRQRERAAARKNAEAQAAAKQAQAAAKQAQAAAKQAKAAATVSNQPAPAPAPAPAPIPQQELRDSTNIKTYTVLFRRSDKHWLVKLDSNPRPLKLFETKEDAVAFAEDLIKHQTAQVLVYGIDGDLQAKLL